MSDTEFEPCGALLPADLARLSGEIACGRPKGHHPPHAPAPGAGNPAAATEAALGMARAEVDAILKALDAVALGQRHPRDPGDWVFAALAIQAAAVLRDARSRIASATWPPG